MKSISPDFDNFVIFNDVISVLFFACFIFLISLFVFKIFRKTSLWIMVKSVRLDFKNVILGVSVFIVSFVFGLAFIYSGILIFLAGLPIFIISFLSAASIIFMPIVLASILAKYVFKKEDYINSKNILYSVMYLSLLLLLPYTLVSIVFFVLFMYTFGICSVYFWNVLVKNTRL